MVREGMRDGEAFLLKEKTFCPKDLLQNEKEEKHRAKYECKTDVEGL